MQSVTPVLLLLPLVLAPQLAGASRITKSGLTRMSFANLGKASQVEHTKKSPQERFQDAYRNGIYRRLCTEQLELPPAAQCAKETSEKLLDAMSISAEDLCLRVELADTSDKKVALFLGDGPDFWCEPIAAKWHEARGRQEVFWANDIKNYVTEVAGEMWEILCKPPDAVTTTPEPRKAFPESSEEAASWCAEDFAQNLRDSVSIIGSVEKLCARSTQDMAKGKGPEFFASIHTNHYWCDPVRQEWKSWKSFFTDPTFRLRVGDGVYTRLCVKEPEPEPPVPENVEEAANVCAREAAKTLPAKLAATRYGTAQTMCKVAAREIEETGRPKVFEFKRITYYCEAVSKKLKSWERFLGKDFVRSYAEELHSLLCTTPTRATVPELPMPKSAEEAGELCAGESAPLLKVKIDKYKPKGGMKGVCSQDRAKEAMLGYVFEDSTKSMMCLPLSEEWFAEGGAWEHLFQN